MAGIPQFDEEHARRLYEISPGTEEEKAAAVANFYGIHGDIVSLIGYAVKYQRKNSLAYLVGDGYEGVEFEPKSPRNGSDKELFTYDKSLERIKAAGKERHARPSEAFSLLIANLEGKLTHVQKLVADDMLDSYGEWFNMAWQRKKDKIILYSDPENIKWDGQKYVVDGRKLICSSEKEFPLATNISDSTFIDLNVFDDGLVQFLYSRQFAQLPKEMREGDKRAHLYLPPKNTLRPLARGYFYGNVSGYDYDIRASRWVVVGRKNSHRK